MTPREYGKHLASLEDPVTVEQAEAAARVLATVVEEPAEEHARSA